MLSSFIKYYGDSFRGLTKETWLLAFITLINRSGSVVFLFLTIYLTEELHFTKGQAGIAASCYGVGSVLGAYVGGYLTDRIGYYKVMLGSLFFVGIMFFVIMNIDSFIPFCIVMIITTLIGDSYRPASAAALSAYENKENLTRALSLYRLAINLGFSMGGAGAGIIAGYWGYKSLFVIDGLTCIIAAILFFVLMAYKKEELKEEDINSTTVPRSAYKDYWYLGFLFCMFLLAFGFMQLLYTFPVFSREELLLTKQEFGVFMAFNGILICILEMPLIAYLTQLKKEYISLIIGGIMICFSFLLFTFLGYSIFVIILFMILISVGEIINFPFSYSIAIRRSQITNRGQYMGLYSIMFSISAIIAPWLGLIIVENYSYDILWSIVAILGLISTFGFLLLRSKQNNKV